MRHKLTIIGFLLGMLVVAGCRQSQDGTDDYVVWASHIELEGEDNMRDLGGYYGEGSRRILYGTLFRSGELSALTDDDKDILTGLGIEQVADLRYASEIEEAPDNLPEGIDYVNLPLLDDTGSGDMSSFFASVLTAEIIADPSQLGTYLDSYMSALYTVTDLKVENWTAFFDLLESSKPTLWHCTAGKDRAGMTAALVLEALGVDRETIYADFLKSNDYLADSIETQVAEIAAALVSLGGGSISETLAAALAEQFRVILGVKESWLDVFYDDIETSYGSVDAFLEVLGVDQDALQGAYLE